MQIKNFSQQVSWCLRPKGCFPRRMLCRDAKHTYYFFNICNWDKEPLAFQVLQMTTPIIPYPWPWRLGLLGVEVQPLKGQMFPMPVIQSYQPSCTLLLSLQHSLCQSSASSFPSAMCFGSLYDSPKCQMNWALLIKEKLKHWAIAFQGLLKPRCRFLPRGKVPQTTDFGYREMGGIVPYCCGETPWLKWQTNLLRHGYKHSWF